MIDRFWDFWDSIGDTGQYFLAMFALTAAIITAIIMWVVVLVLLFGNGFFFFGSIWVILSLSALIAAFIVSVS